MTPDADMTYDGRISARVREIRLLRGLSQADVARQIGIGRDVFTRHELNQRARGWPVSLLADVADVLEVPLAALVPGERVVCEGCGAIKGALAHASLPAPEH
jgi:transcriptional regulator with XRE-family HTH domain